MRASAPVGPAHITVQMICISGTDMAFDGAASICVVAACDLEMYEPRVRVVTPNRCWRQPCLAESERAQADHGDQLLHMSEGSHWTKYSHSRIRSKSVLQSGHHTSLSAEFCPVFGNPRPVRVGQAVAEVLNDLIDGDDRCGRHGEFRAHISERGAR